MPLNVISLASGSSGNCALVEAGSRRLLVDAGLSASAILARLQDLRADPRSVAAVLLTHEHSDHVTGAGAIARKLRVPVVGNAATLSAAFAQGPVPEVVLLPANAEATIGGLDVRSFSIPHDAADPVGYRIAFGRTSVCFMTDTGHVDARLLGELGSVQLAILESNHDVQRLIRGPYTDPLKARILGDRGHLSNDAAGEAVATLSQGDHPTCVWLAHLSAVNNTRTLALRAARLALRDGSPHNVRLSVALRDCTSLIWRSDDNWWQRRLF